VIAPTVPGGGGGRGQQRLGFGAGQEGDGGVVVAFEGDGQYLGDQRGVFGDVERGVAEQ
jgi:hypothetical protein